MSKKILSLLLVAVMCLSLLAGCGSSATTTTAATEAPAATVAPTAEPTAEPTPEPTPEVTPEPETRTVVDSTGTEVVMPYHVETVMTFGSVGVINTLVETLGCGDRLACNLSERFQNPKWAMQYTFAPQMKDLPTYEDKAGNIDIEGVVAADPDLCIVMQPATAEELRNAGLTVLCLGFGNGKTSAALTDAVDMLGEALGVEDKAAEYSAYVDEMVDKIASVTSSLTDETKKSVLYGQVEQGQNPHILIEWVISAAGGISCTGDIHESGTCEFSKEDVLKWDPDFIMMINDESADLKADTAINTVTAIAEDHMYIFPTVGHFITGSTEAPVGILFLTHLMYPDLYSYDELADDIYYFYDNFFGYQMTDEEIFNIINVNGTETAAN